MFYSLSQSDIKPCWKPPPCPWGRVLWCANGFCNKGAFSGRFEDAIMPVMVVPLQNESISRSDNDHIQDPVCSMTSLIVCL